MILEDNAKRHIEEILPVAFKCENNWTYQQNGTRPPILSFNQRWCADRFRTFILKNRRAPNSPDLCPLDNS